MRSFRRARLPQSVWTLFIVGFCAALLANTGCMTRTVRHRLIEQNLIEVDLVREVSGFSVEERGYEHPATISAERLAHILGALEIESRDKKGGLVREPAFQPETLPRTAEQLSRAFAEAGPNEEIGVKVIRKERRLGVFHRKFLTTFLAYMDDDHLYLLLRRVEWPIPQADKKQTLPEPSRNRKVMNFRLVTGDPIFFAGVQDVEVAWRNPVFRTAFRLPGSTKGERRRRELLETSPIPRDEFEEGRATDADLEQLTPSQLRALADLEEERQAGRITETAYQRARRQLLRRR